MRELLEKTLTNHYSVIALILLATTMIWNRLHGLHTLITPTQIYFRGPDAYYHYRHTLHTVNHYPRTLAFDTLTNFPKGTAAGQFGTLYDQTAATITLILTTGHPTPRTTALVLLFFPVALAILTLPVVYQLARTHLERPASLYAATVFALSNGIYLQYTMLGRADHNAAEPLLHATAILTLLHATHHHTWKHRTLTATAITLYLLVWPPAILLVAILALATLTSYTLLTTPTKQQTTTVVTATLAPAILLLPLSDLSSMSSSSLSLLQLLILTATAAGAIFLHSLHSHIPTRTHRTAVVAAIGSAAVVTLNVVWPRVLERFVDVARRFVFFGTTPGTSVISEAQPFPSSYALQLGITNLQAIHVVYGAAFAAALIGFLRYTLTTIHRPTHARVLVIVWSLVLWAAAFTQVRFNYYLVLPVAYYNGVLFQGLTQAFELESWRDVDRGSLVAIGGVYLIVASSLVAPMAAPTSNSDNGAATVEKWNPALEYLQSDTPPLPPEITTPDHQHSQALHAKPGGYDYPESAYGVLSWWDYGHYITVLGERPAVANPLQQHAVPAARILLAPNTTRAHAELTVVEEPDARVEYIIITDRMLNASGKLHGIATTHPTLTFDELYSDGSYTERYRASFMVQLYTKNATQTRGWRLVFSENGVKIFERTPRSTAS